MCRRPQLPDVLRSQGRAKASRASALTTAALAARGLATCQHRAGPEDPTSHLLLKTSEHMRCTRTAGSRLGGQRRASLAQICLPSKPDPASHPAPSPRLAGHPGSSGRGQPSERQRRQGVLTGHALHGVLPVLYARPWGDGAGLPGGGASWGASTPSTFHGAGDPPGGDQQEQGGFSKFRQDSRSFPALPARGLQLSLSPGSRGEARPSPHPRGGGREGAL